MKSYLALLALALFLSSCQTAPTGGSNYLAGLSSHVPQKPQQMGVAEHVSFWDDDGSAGPAHGVVDLKRQVAEFWRGDKLIGVAAISSGTEGRNTPEGEYKIIEKIVDKYSNLYGWIEDAEGNVVNDDAGPKTPLPPGCVYKPAPMRYWMRLTNGGIGMHEGYLPGYPASHGCIRMDRNMVQKFYANAYVGMPIRVVR